MACRNQFTIQNGSTKSLTLNVEPEGAHVPLESGGEVIVVEEFTNFPLTLKWTESDTGDAIVSIWPGDGELKVEKGRVNVLELVHKEGTV